MIRSFIMGKNNASHFHSFFYGMPSPKAPLHSKVHSTASPRMWKSYCDLISDLIIACFSAVNAVRPFLIKGRPYKRKTCYSETCIVESDSIFRRTWDHGDTIHHSWKSLYALHFSRACLLKYSLTWDTIDNEEIYSMTCHKNGDWKASAN